jgi:hypothetical protein
VNHSYASIFLWHFRGQTSRSTAQHFKKHLLEFIAKENLGARPLGVLNTSNDESEVFATATVWMAVANLEEGKIAKALRPQNGCSVGDFQSEFPLEWKSACEEFPDVLSPNNSPYSY